MPEPNEARMSLAQDAHTMSDPVAEYGLIVEGDKASPLFRDREAAEQYAPPWNPGRRAYGALPHLKSKEKTLELFAQETAYFSQTYKTKEPGAPPWRDASYAEGMILFEAKFGKKLSAFAQEILKQYPPVDASKPGRVISVFGLSGSGKSTAMEALREMYGECLIEMDSDTVRYNLLARMILDVETQNGATLEEVRSDLMHNNISGSMYLLLHHLTKTLRSRGYTVVRSSTMPDLEADATMYLTHPDGIDPRQIADEDVPTVAKTLFERTQARVGEKDDYDWEHAQTVLDFQRMKPVSVQVPERVHEAFLKSLRATLNNPSIHYTELPNKKIDDAAARKVYYIEALKRAIQV